MEASETEDLLSEAEAAALLGVDRTTLGRWRRDGHAPRHTEYPSGTVRYARQDVIDWREHFVFPPGDVDGRQGGRA